MAMQIYELDNTNKHCNYSTMIVIAPDAKTASHFHPVYGLDGTIRHPSCLGGTTESKWYETPEEYCSAFDWDINDVQITHLGIADPCYDKPKMISAC